MRSSSLFSGFGASALLLLSASPVSADCICRFNGGEVTHGHTACLVTAKGRELARCEKSLNMSTWKFLGQPFQQLPFTANRSACRLWQRLVQFDVVRI